MLATLDTPRLVLRPLADDDEDFYVKLFTDPVTLARIAPPQTPEQARAGFRTWLARDRRLWPLWVMVRREDQARLGVVGLDTIDGVAEIGVVCPPAAHGQGYGPEAALAMLAHAFGVMGFPRIEGRHVADHPVVDRRMRELGFLPGPTGAPPHPRRWVLTRERWAEVHGDKAGRIG
ncbi:GNAT family N-acetyltransferase [bacterium BD-1]|nr:GNAT family N-acetyltransferase [Ottowia caeni]